MLQKDLDNEKDTYYIFIDKKHLKDSEFVFYFVCILNPKVINSREQNLVGGELYGGDIQLEFIVLIILN